MKIKRWRTLLVSMLVAVFLVVGLAAPVVQAATPDQIEQAIDDGLVWLADMQGGPGPGNGDGSWNGSIGHTGLAVLKFETHAVFGGMSPFDPAYTYNLNVENGLDYIFGFLEVVDISSMPAADTNGNGIGLRCSTWGQWTYESAIALMAICAGNDPGRTVTVGPQATRTYEDVAQDIVDYLAFGQNDGGPQRGGWGYEENYGWADNSNSGYATIGLGFAEAAPPYGFGLTIPPFVRPELNIWVDYIQDGSGGSGYDAPWNWVNILKTGNLLQQQHMVGYNQLTPQVQAAIGYIEAHWNDANQDPGWKDSGAGPGAAANYQACFTLMKGFMSLGITEINVGGPLDWYDDMSDRIVETQDGDGKWSGDYWGDDVLATAWAMLALEKAAPPALELEPPFATNEPVVGTEHTITATYKVAGEPVQGAQIDFEIIAGPNMGETGSDLTDENGEATFNYLHGGGEGTDTIEASVIDPDTGAVLVSSQATKTWQAIVIPQVPSMTVWGMIATVIALGILIPLALRRRALSSVGR